MHHVKRVSVELGPLSLVPRPWWWGLAWTAPPSWVAAGLWAVTACIAAVVAWQGLATFQRARQGHTIAFDHNNYLVWLVPLVGLALLAGLQPASRSVRARTAIGGRAGTASPAGAILDGERVA